MRAENVSHGAGDGPDVLMVEDDPTLSRMYRLKLVAEGFRVRVATDGPSGLAAARRPYPDMLLLDIRIPGFAGFELLERLRETAQGARVPVIVLSNYGQEEIVERSAALGAAAHLVKSRTTPMVLVAAIRHHLEEAALQQP